MKQEASNKIVAFSDERLVIMMCNVRSEVIVRAEIHTTYVHDEDVTIVWQNLIVGDECIQRALIGWYCGEPDLETTKQYSNMPLIGQFID